MRAPFIVWSPDGETPPKVQHNNHKSAHHAARCMAKEHPSQTFYVMGVCGKEIRHLDEEVKA